MPVVHESNNERARPGAGAPVALAQKNRMDDIDLKLIELLQREGRLSNKVLAGRVNLSPSACLERVRRLEAKGAIIGYRAVVGEVMSRQAFEGWAAITLHERTEGAIEATMALLKASEYVLSAYELAGPFDVLVHIVAPNIADWRALAREIEHKLAGSVRVGIVLRTLKALSPLPIKRLSAGRAAARD